MNDLIESIASESDNILFIKGERDGRYPYSHSLLINDYLIDTGVSDRRLKKIKRTYNVNHVLLSHWHEDHISGNNMLDNAKFYCHPKDKHIIEDLTKMNDYYGTSDMPIENLYDDLMEMLNMSNTKIDGLFEDNDMIDLGNDLRLKVIHTPGHSAGHCCFFELKTRIAFMADIDLTSFGPWYAGLDSSVIDFEESIKKLLDLDIDVAVTSHKGLFQGKKLINNKLNEFLSRIYERDELILEQLSEKTPRNAEDIANKNIIYKFYSMFKNYEILAEQIMFRFHFDKFLKNNIIEPKENGYVLS
jgi:glyoxylase-like metal-dependent hydrolase (beta-lactamase superfamily II)